MIQAEREEQIKKHGFDSIYDIHSNRHGQLRYGALYMLTGDELDFPMGWGREWKTKFDKKNSREKLIIAGALIAAELDRINTEDEQRKEEAETAKY